MTWLITQFYASFEKMDLAILEVVGPVTREFERDIETFHFFREPGHLLFRILCKDGKEETVKSSILTMAAPLRADGTLSEVKSWKDANYSEADSFGEDGWKVAQRFFELGSRLGMMRTEYSHDGKQLPWNFNEGKFVHLILNQWGYAVGQEADFHFKTSGERLALLRFKFDPGNTRKYLPEILARMYSETFPKIIDIVNSVGGDVDSTKLEVRQSQ